MRTYKTEYTAEVHHNAKRREFNHKTGTMNPPPVTLHRVEGTRRVEVLRAERKAKKDAKA